MDKITIETSVINFHNDGMASLNRDLESVLCSNVTCSKNTSITRLKSERGKRAIISYVYEYLHYHTTVVS